ncbi:hypothetical protein KKJFFJLC_00038 [Vibrio phage vB_VpaS_PGB]|nr:hypothetical protein HHKILHMN_00059 [Vibrio phage vB_VpaS_PGA]WVH05581.1 hypothetical protein KKJFFJLC_00038 [Vibrio phage vB_VpaS_PGB]
MSKDLVQVEGSESMTIQQNQQSFAPMQLIQLAVEKGGAVDQLEKLMDLQERWDAKQAKEAYFQALAKFQSIMPVIEKKKEVSYQSKKPGVPPTFYKYAPLDDIMVQIRPSLEACSLTVRWEQVQLDGGVISVTCVVTHVQGHSERVTLNGSPDQSGMKNNIQSTASTVTYLRRYTVTGALGIATADEDFDGRVPAYLEAKNQEAEEKQLQEFKFYPDSTFASNWPKWLKGVESGKISKENLINKLESKGHTLTDEQRKQIKEIK